MLIKPAFDLGTLYNWYAEGTLLTAQSSVGFPSSFPNCEVLDAPSLVRLLCKTIEELTGASLQELFSCTSKPVDLDCLPVPTVLLDTVPRARSQNLMSFSLSNSNHQRAPTVGPIL